MLKGGHLFPYCIHKGLLYLCPSVLISFALCLQAPPPHPAQARNIFFCLLRSLSNFYLSVFFHMVPYVSNKSPLSIWQVTFLSFIFLLMSHIPWKSIFLWSVFPSELLQILKWWRKSQQYPIFLTSLPRKQSQKTSFQRSAILFLLWCLLRDYSKSKRQGCCESLLCALLNMLVRFWNVT